MDKNTFITLSEILATIGVASDDFKKDIDEDYSRQVKSMIDDAEEIAKDLKEYYHGDNSEKFELAIENVSKMIRNTHMFDKDDAKLVTKKDCLRLSTAICSVRATMYRVLNILCNKMYNIVNDYDDIIAKKDNENTSKDDLESLSKDELIARLREKSK